MTLARGWRRAVAALATCALNPGISHAQDVQPGFVHESWSVQDGLPVNGITRLIQSRDGYLWMATFDGLVRFDGVRFTVFSTGNTEGLPSNRIVDLLEAQDGSLWMRTEQRHIVRFLNGAFTSYGPEDGLGAGATTLHEDQDGRIWIGTEKGMRYVEDERLHPFAEDVLDRPVEEILRASDGALWIAVRHVGVRRIQNGNVTTWTHDRGLAHNTVLALYEDEKGRIWIGSEGGIDRYQDGQLIPTPFAETLPRRSRPVIEFLGVPGSDEMWVGTSRHIFLYKDDEIREIGVGDGSLRYPGSFGTDAEGNICFFWRGKLYRNGTVVYEMPAESQGLAEIRSVLHDHEGSVWIATGTQGLHRLKPSVFAVYGEAQGVANKNIYPILESRDGSIWLGTWGSGVTRIKNGEVTKASANALVLSLCEDRRRRLWIGALYGAYPHTLTDGVLERISGAPSVYSAVYAIHEDRTGELWIGAERGLYRVRGDSLIQATGLDGTPASYTRVFRETRNGSLWMGTSGAGLERYRNGRFESFTEADGLSSNLIRAIYEDEDGYLWVGTEGRGLCRLDRHGSEDLSQITVAVYRQKDGLFDEVIHQILEDDSGRLWMSTNRGIFWVTREQLNAFADGRATRIVSTSYTERDGMRNREANGGMQPAGIRASDGRLWWPTQDGAVVVDPARVQRNTVPPPVAIEAVKVDGVTVAGTASTVQLQARQRDFEIEYTAMSFLAPENVRFRYRLEGFNDAWIQEVDRRTAFYTNVPPGEYRFHVIASNNDGVWNEAGASLALTVQPFFYETPWFRSSMAALAMLLVVMGYRWRTGQLAARERELKEIVAVRTRDLEREKETTENERARAEKQRLTAEHLRELAEQARATVEAQAEKLKTLDEAKSLFFANVSHEFRTPLTLTIGPLEDLLNGLHGKLGREMTDELELALRNARRLLRLVNQILDIAKLESGQMKLEAERTDIAAFLRDVALTFSSLAERGRVRFQIDTPNEPLWLYADRDLQEKIFTNLLSNAFKFTPEGGTVRLALDATRAQGEAGEVDIIVRDSGPGIAADKVAHIFDRFFQADESASWQPGTGIGLSLTKELVELHDGRIAVETQEGFGSTFTVTLRCGKAHLAPDAVIEPKRKRTRTEPVMVEAGEDAASRDASVPAEPAGDEDVTTLLVIDDNAEIRRYIRRHLEPAYRVMEAANGAAGLETARRSLPDLVISDVMMPDMDGYALCDALKRDPELDYIPVILLTAKATTAAKLDGLKRGADDYLTKPFDINELRARVANLVASRQRLRERFSRGGATVHASDVPVTAGDDAFLERLREAVEAEMGDEEFSVDRLAEQMGMSRGHLHRRLRELLAETPTHLIRRVRLERAMQLLAGRAGSVSEVAYGVGFKSVSHFSQCFREHAGTTPSQYAAESTPSTS